MSSKLSIFFRSEISVKRDEYFPLAQKQQYEKIEDYKLDVSRLTVIIYFFRVQLQSTNMTLKRQIIF